jgi:hypothetical protein
MEEHSDRRYMERYQISGAEVLYRSQSTSRIWSKFQGPVSVVNLSKSGICFKTAKKMVTGEQYEIKVLIPKERKIKLKGKIVWTTSSYQQKATLAGMHFLPFGGDKKYNPLSSLTRLRNATENLH